MKFWQSCFVPSSWREGSSDRIPQTRWQRGAPSTALLAAPKAPGREELLPPPQLFSICSMSISPSSWKRLSVPVVPLRQATPSSSFPALSSSSSQDRSSLLARRSSGLARGGSGTGVQAGVLPGITSGAAGHGCCPAPGSRCEPASAGLLRQVRLLKVWRFCRGKGREQLRGES